MANSNKMNEVEKCMERDLHQEILKQQTVLTSIKNYRRDSKNYKSFSNEAYYVSLLTDLVNSVVHIQKNEYFTYTFRTNHVILKYLNALAVTFECR